MGPSGWVARRHARPAAAGGKDETRDTPSTRTRPGRHCRRDRAGGAEPKPARPRAGRGADVGCTGRRWSSWPNPFVPAVNQEGPEHIDAPDAQPQLGVDALRRPRAGRPSALTRGGPASVAGRNHANAMGGDGLLRAGIGGLVMVLMNASNVSRRGRSTDRPIRPIRPMISTTSTAFLAYHCTCLRSYGYLSRHAGGLLLSV
jgi:hypothetical protein